MDARHASGLEETKRQHSTLVLILVLLACTALSRQLPAADAAVPQQADGEAEVLDEVIVEGTRLWRLRAAVIDAEERFYARYNELNQDDDFDMHCVNEAPLGTRIKQRICRLEFYQEAQAQYAMAVLRGEDLPAHPDLVALERLGEYRKVALELINGDPELSRLVREREAAEKKYHAARKDRFKRRLASF